MCNTYMTSPHRGQKNSLNLPELEFIDGLEATTRVLWTKPRSAVRVTNVLNHQTFFLAPSERFFLADCGERNGKTLTK